MVRLVRNLVVCAMLTVGVLPGCADAAHSTLGEETATVVGGVKHTLGGVSAQQVRLLHQQVSGDPGVYTWFTQQLRGHGVSVRHYQAQQLRRLVCSTFGGSLFAGGDAPKMFHHEVQHVLGHDVTSMQSGVVASSAMIAFCPETYPNFG